MHLSPPGLLAPRLSDLVTIPVRHADIQEHGIGAERLRNGQGRAANVNH
jgi:hypothetical protein